MPGIVLVIVTIILTPVLLPLYIPVFPLFCPTFSTLFCSSSRRENKCWLETRSPGFLALALPTVQTCSAPSSSCFR